MRACDFGKICTVWHPKVLGLFMTRFLCARDTHCKYYNHTYIQHYIRFAWRDLKTWKTGRNNFIKMSNSTSHLCEKTLPVEEPSYQLLFEQIPIALLEVDFSDAMEMLESRYAETGNNPASFLIGDLAEVDTYMAATNLTNINSACLKLFEYDHKDDVLNKKEIICSSENSLAYSSILVGIANGSKAIVNEAAICTQKGNIRNVLMRSNIKRHHQGIPAYSRIIIAFTDSILDYESKLTPTRGQTGDSRYLNRANILLFSMNRSGYVTMVNTKLSDMLRVLPKDIIGKHWISHFVPSSAHDKQELIFQTLLSGQTSEAEETESQIINCKGELFTISWFNTVIRDVQGEILEIVASGTDVTAQRQLEQDNLMLETRLQRTERLNSLSIMARGVAHEINNPLTGLLNYAAIIEDEIDNPELQEFARGIKNEGTRVSEIVNNLLTFARRESGPKQQVKVIQVIEKAVMLINQSLITDNILLDLSCVDRNISIFCQVQDIQHVLLNILTNSWQAILRKKSADSSANNKIIISTLLSGSERHQYLRISLKDQGEGIEKADIENVFIPFFSGQPRTSGVGLGLAIAYGIIRDHGGKIEIYSDLGVGTEVVLELPYGEHADATTSAGNAG